MSREREKGMSLIVKTVTRLTVGLILLYGVYILSHGHVSPGGGFAGGVIIALSFIHLMLAYGKETALAKLPKGITTFFEGMGEKCSDRSMVFLNELNNRSLIGNKCVL